MALLVKVGVDYDLDLRWDGGTSSSSSSGTHPWKAVESVEVWVAVQQALDLV